jgi:hypothetical protein
MMAALSNSENKYIQGSGQSEAAATWLCGHVEEVNIVKF